MTRTVRIDIDDNMARDQIFACKKKLKITIGAFG